MTLQDRLNTLGSLHAHLSRGEDEFLTALQKRTEFNNKWFDLSSQQSSLNAIRDEYLAKEKLEQWIAEYPELQPDHEPKHRLSVGLVLAGNIPLVGFHDILCVYVAGYTAKIKLSSKDQYVLPYLLNLLGQFDERASAYFEIVENLKIYDAVIATGSNNSARYFAAYFSKVPHIIRKNRNAVAVLSGQESNDDFRALGRDVFTYYGLGCRNVSKLYVPSGYDFQPLLEVFHEWKQLQNHPKWKNNFDYNYALTTLNKESFHLTGPLMVLEEEAIISRIATLHFSYYEDVSTLEKTLADKREEIQLVVAQPGFLSSETFDFGHAQQPGLRDYADGVDTVRFLVAL